MQPPVPGRATLGPFVGSGKINRQPWQWKYLWLCKSRQTGRDREGPQTGRLGKQASACVQGADQTPWAAGPPAQTDGIYA